MPSLVTDYHDFIKETQKLNNLLASINTPQISPAHRKYIAEIALLRLAILIENTMKSIFCKICCGAVYIDGTTPKLLAQQRNIPKTLIAMQTLNRNKKRAQLPWNDGREIRENIKFIINSSDQCHTDLINHSGYLTDIRYIRNHIAHRNDNTRINFSKLIRRYYGAKARGVKCGDLLLSPRVSPTRPLLEELLIKGNVMMKDLLRA